MQNQLRQIAVLQHIVDDSHDLVFFGGAGVSTESGLPDFRSADGLYRQKFRYPPEVMLSHSFFVRHPAEFFEFHKAQMIHFEIRPNPAHDKLTELERASRLLAVVTQNIDGLHQMAGTQKVLELHGSIHRNYCLKCRRQYAAAYVVQSSGIPRCTCGGMIRPDVVLYEEGLDQAVMSEAAWLISQADTLIVGGTSLAVYPAAGLVDYFRGRHLVLINKEATSLDDQAELVIREPIGTTLSWLKVKSER